MKKIAHSLLIISLSFFFVAEVVIAASEDEDFLLEEEDLIDDEEKQKLVEEQKKREAEERKKQEEALEKARKEEEKRKAIEAKREAIKKQNLKLRKEAEAKEAKLNSLREADADTTEYTLEPSSVELVVEMDPKNYGFRTRDHKMILALNADPLFRGRGSLSYEFRFFNYLSIGLVGGIDYSALSIYSRIREELSKRSPFQLAVLGGSFAKWRLTEWYMKSAFFLEPSVLFGHLWQTLHGSDTKHWRLRPGMFLGSDSVFDSGFVLTARFGLEFPFDFGTPNPVKDILDPLFILSFGFAI